MRSRWVDLVMTGMPRWTHQRRLALARDLLPHLELQPLVSQRFPVEHAAEAFALVDEHPDQTVQVLLTYTQA